MKQKTLQSKITNKAFLKALEKVGGEAKITPLYEAFDKTDFAEVKPAKLKTALRNKGKELAKKQIVLETHPGGKRNIKFVLNIDFIIDFMSNILEIFYK